MPGCPFVERGLIHLVIFCLSRKSMYSMSVEYYVKDRPIGWLRFCTLCKSHTYEGNSISHFPFQFKLLAYCIVMMM